MYDHEAHCDKEYRGFRLYGWARSVDNYSPSWFAVSNVYVQRRDNSLYGVGSFSDSGLTYEDQELAAMFGLLLGEITVDHFAAPLSYYLTPMNMAWAVDILRRGAEDYLKRNVEKRKFYEALEYLEERLEERA